MTASCKEFNEKLNRCRKNNLNAIWATEKLYVSGHSMQEFVNILENNMKPIYDAAKIQGYDTWIINTENNY